MKRSQVIQILMGVVSVWFLVAEVDAADYTVKLPAIDDSYVYEGIPDANYDSDPNLRIGYDLMGKEYKIYLKFDLSTIPAEADIWKVELFLAATGDFYNWPSQIDDPNIFVCKVNHSNWTEESITWNGSPLWDSRKISVLDTPFPPVGRRQWIFIDPLGIGMVAACHASGEPFSCMLRISKGSDCYVEFYSKEYPQISDTDKPFLEVNYSLPLRATNPEPADGAIGISSAPLLNTYISNDVPLDIPDRGRVETTVFSSLDIPESFTITDLNVQLDITQPNNNADLNVFLIGPDGTRVELFTDVGVTSWDDFKNTVLDDEASISVVEGRGNFEGTYRPEGKLSDFDGKNAQGTWKLEITDDWANNAGTLNSWKLNIESPNILSWIPGDGIASQDVYFSNNFDDVNDSADAAYQGNFVADISTIEVDLDPNQTYFWRIDSLGVDGMLIVVGDVWCFTTTPKTAHDPYPADGAELVGPNMTLSWTAGLGAKMHHVYFGDNFDDVEAGTGGTDKGIQLTSIYAVPLLELETIYFWRVDEFDGFEWHRGPVWVIPRFIPRPDLIRNYTPAVWQTPNGEFVKWSRDINPRNGIDDLIDAMNNGQLVDIVVNYKRSVERKHLTELKNLEVEILGRQVPQLGTRPLKYISSVALSKVPVHMVRRIPELSDVAFVEIQVFFETALDISVPNIRVAASVDYSPNTVEDRYPRLDGSGVNIVIMDTGVDNTVHDAFNGTPFIGGYDAYTQTFGDPDDAHGHGTHVASIALGQSTADTVRGVAPAAGLIDVKTIPGSWSQVTDALETIYDNRGNWLVKVINMSFWVPGVSDDGIEAFSQLVDLAPSMGIVAVACAGNGGPNNNGISTPGAATRAITVAASDDRNTVNRSDDVIAGFSSRGERADDGDHDVLDELKPEVAAPGTYIVAARHDTTDNPISMSGTSMATPHISGLSALIMQASPAINPISVKDIIISTTEQKGIPSAPGKDTQWNDAWGWGLVDGFAAVNTAQSSNADLSYPSHPPTPIWLSPDISVSPPPKVGQQSTITVQVENKGPAFAYHSRIHFGIHDYSASIPVFYDIGTRIVNLPKGITPISMNWTPQYSGHMCMETEIGYGPDANYSNNKAQRNITVASSSASFRVRNTLTEEPKRIDFVPSFEFKTDTPWEVTITPSYVNLAADNPPEDVTVLLIPPVGAQRGETQIVHVAAVIEVDNHNVQLGGVSVQYTVPGGTVVDDFEAYSDLWPWWIHRIWIDGLGYIHLADYHPGNGTGSIVGQLTGSFAERTMIHGGKQSMPFSYDNSRGPVYYFSEAERTFDTPTDWTEEGMQTLSLWFHGDPSNDPEPMYVAVADSTGTPAVVVHDDPAVAKIDTWTEWVIPLQTFADQGIDLTVVDRIAIGFGTKGNVTIPGGKGKMYFDDIRLCPPR